MCALGEFSGEGQDGKGLLLLEITAMSLVTRVLCQRLQGP